MFLIDKKRSSSCIWNVKVRCRFEWASGSRRRVDLYGKVFWSQNYFSLFFHKTILSLCSNENFVYKKVLFFWIFCEDSAKIRIYSHIFLEVPSWKSRKSSERGGFDTIKWTKDNTLTIYTDIFWFWDRKSPFLSKERLVIKRD